MSDLYTFTDGSVDDSPPVTTLHGPPTAEVIAALMEGVVRITRRCEILNSDFTPFYPDISMIAGDISVDATRDERRTISITLADGTGRTEARPGGLWYDKLIRPWRGLVWDDGAWETPLGTFMIDNLGDGVRVKNRPRPRPNSTGTNLDPVEDVSPFLLSIDITGRDLTKKFILSTFDQDTTFLAGTDIDTIIRAEVANAGFTSVVVPWSADDAPVLGVDTTFSADSSRYAACNQIIQAYGFELFIDPYGTPIIRVYQDPTTFPPTLTFQTGVAGNLVTYKKTINDSELFNRVVVRGSGQLNALVFAAVQITDPDSPIHESKIGRRTYPFPSAIVSTDDEALALATTLLSIHSLESYEIDMDSIVFPWLEAGNVVSFFDDAAPPSTDPDRFWLSDFKIPLALDAMNCTAKRVVSVVTT